MSAKDSKDFGPDLNFSSRDLSMIGIEFAAESGFSEVTVAARLRQLVSEGEIDLQSEGILLCMADALDHPEAKWKLKIVQTSRGRQATYAEKVDSNYRDEIIAHAAWDSLQANGKMEASLAHCMSMFGISRATVFNSIRRASDHQKLLQRMMADDPYLGISEQERRKNPQYMQYINWLDRYSHADGDKAS